MMGSSSIDEKTQKVLYEEFPVRITRMSEDIYASTVRETQASPIELIGLINDIKMALVQRAAKDYPLCNIREEALYGLSRELLRQLIIECPERGLLFKQVLEEHYKYFEAYKILLQHNEAFLSRKNLQAAYIKNFQLEKVYIQNISSDVSHVSLSVSRRDGRHPFRYLCANRQTAGPPVDTVVEILSPINHFKSLGGDRHLLAIIQALEEEIEILEQKASALQEASEKMKKKFQEERISAENRRQAERRYENQLTEQLKVRQSHYYL
ncbi:hypothetical protein ACTXT7_009198 [Hymenolepis weldensis]